MLPLPIYMILQPKNIQYQSVAHCYIVCDSARGIAPINGDSASIQLPPFTRLLDGSIEVDVAFDTLSVLDVGVKKDLQRYAKGVELNKTHSTKLVHLPQKFVNSANIVITFRNGNPFIGEATIRLVYEVDGRVHATR